MISVILLTYNSIRVLPGCIQSLTNCTSSRELEVIVVDNGSTDGTQQWIADYSHSNHNVFEAFRSIQLDSNFGFAYGNNRAMEIARGEFIMLLNPDTLVGKTAIATCVERLENNVEIGAIGCRLELPNGSLDRACKRTFPNLWNSFSRLCGLSFLFPKSHVFAQYNLTFLDEFDSYQVDCLCGAFMVVPRHVYQSVGGLDEAFFMYGEDIDWCYRIKQANYKVWYDGTVSTVHLKGGNGGKQSRQSLKHFYDTMYLYYTKTRHHSTKSALSHLIRLMLRCLYHAHVVIRRVPE